MARGSRKRTRLQTRTAHSHTASAYYARTGLERVRVLHARRVPLTTTIIIIITCQYDGVQRAIKEITGRMGACVYSVVICSAALNVLSVTLRRVRNRCSRRVAYKRPYGLFSPCFFPPAVVRFPSRRLLSGLARPRPFIERDKINIDRRSSTYHTVVVVAAAVVVGGSRTPP